MLRVVLDTNVLLVSISPNAPNHWIIRHFLNEGFILCVTTDILLEYEEVITRHMGALTATNFMEALDHAPHVELITRYFKWGLIEADLTSSLKSAPKHNLRISAYCMTCTPPNQKKARRPLSNGAPVSCASIDFRVQTG